MQHPEKILYTAHAKAAGGRDGYAKSSDGLLDIKLVAPKELGGAGVGGTNPEQLFAAGYAACFIGAMRFVAGKNNVKLPDDTHINSSVSLGPIPTGFIIAVELKVNIPNMDKAEAQKIVDAAHIVCPYSNATRGNIDVKISVV